MQSKWNYRLRELLNGIGINKTADDISGCCFDEASLRETTYCSSSPPHHFCYVCARKYSEIEIGNMKYYLRKGHHFNVDLSWFALMVRDVQHLFRRLKLRNFSTRKLSSVSTSLERIMKSSRSVSKFISIFNIGKSGRSSGMS